jgi:hypothetical protein
MGLGVPVIVTEQCNLPAVATHKCGWVIRATVDQLISALTDVLCSNASRRSLFGKNGQRLVAQRYTWPAIGREMTAVYRWLNGGPTPQSVITRQDFSKALWAVKSADGNETEPLPQGSGFSQERNR